jgi:hypothetical protein
MPEYRPHDNRRSDREGQQPVGEGRKVFPHRQPLSVVDIEGDRTLRLYDMGPRDVLTVQCSYGSIGRFASGLQRKHHLPSDLLIDDLQFRLRCGFEQPATRGPAHPLMRRRADAVALAARCQCTPRYRRRRR